MPEPRNEWMFGRKHPLRGHSRAMQLRESGCSIRKPEETAKIKNNYGMWEYDNNLLRFHSLQVYRALTTVPLNIN